MTAPYCDPLRLPDNGWHAFLLRRTSKEPAVTGWMAQSAGRAAAGWRRLRAG